VQGIGAAFSTTLAGLIITGGGYGLAFLTLAGIAVAALLVLLFLMPETLSYPRHKKVKERDHGAIA
jgi:MFS family permease